MTRRNREILRLFAAGVRQADIARRFGISPSRVKEIIIRDRFARKEREALESRYGVRPNIKDLPDDTPITVLIAHKSKMHGWAVRVKSLRHAPTPILTLGDLRHTPDKVLLKQPNVGKTLVKALRMLCPYEPPAV